MVDIESIKNSVNRALEILDKVSDRIDRYTIIAEGMPYEELEAVEIEINTAWRELTIVQKMIEEENL